MTAGCSKTLSRTTVWLDRGVTRSLDQGFAGFEAWRDAILEQEESETHKLGRKIAMEEDWLRYGVTARRTRNQRRLAELHALRRQRREHRRAAGSVRLEATQAEMSGRLVAEAAGIAKSYGGRPIVRNFSTRIMRGDRVGIIGPNGAGKTTLLNMLIGVLPPDAGAVRLGANLAPVVLDQRRESLDPEQTLAEALTGGSGDTVTVAGQSRHVVGYMKDFLFRPEQARTPVGVLSGGERARLRWRAPSRDPPICWCSTSRPTISTSKRSICCRSVWPNIRGRCCWSATTAIFSTAS